MVEGELAIALFGSVCVLLLFGFPVALTLAGTALLFAAVGVVDQRPISGRDTSVCGVMASLS